MEGSRCGINFLLKKIPVVRAVFEPGTSRSLSQRPTIDHCSQYSSSILPRHGVPNSQIHDFCA
ncbi:hypothetical protein DPMN_118924 [Dreissena polymorpha]|uniref:Uncharacterized protein n=1 Tax=Dreissena polymorpha TaxID=45954 RepID=A0A9D4GHX0_DREPO|nr:hypothetical protein DPMN_118924 [Dreissena polymorpha]